MPSMLVGQPLASGPQLIISGNPWSGQLNPPLPNEGINFKWLCPVASGFGVSGLNCYIGFSGIQTSVFPASGLGQSGNVLTINSGGTVLTNQASGMLDGMPVLPGQSYFVPRGALQRNLFIASGNGLSGLGAGNITVFVGHDPGASGIGRLYWEADTRYGW